MININDIPEPIQSILQTEWDGMDKSYSTIFYNSRLRLGLRSYSNESAAIITLDGELSPLNAADLPIEMVTRNGEYAFLDVKVPVSPEYTYNSELQAYKIPFERVLFPDTPVRITTEYL